MDINAFIHLVFIGIIALFPVVNPFGSSFIVNPYFSNLSIVERKQTIKRVVLYSFMVCVVTMLVGHWILALFGLTIPVIQLAGGIMICKIGWDFLTSDSSDSFEKDKVMVADDRPGSSSLSSKIFYPITFPMTIGAGTISVIFTLSAHSATHSIGRYFINLGALLISIIVVCALIYIFYSNADRLIKFMGSSLNKIVNRLMAFLIFCVGLQIAVGGIATLIKGF